MPTNDQSLHKNVLQKFTRLNTWKQGSHRAPHKPLLILYALARWQQGIRQITFIDTEPDLTALLREFGPPRKSDHPDQPFWRLQNDGVWVVETPGELPLKKGDSIPKVAALRSPGVLAGFSLDVQQAFEADTSLITNIATQILHEHFPESYHHDILNAVGLQLEDFTASKRKRDPSFRPRILKAYEYRCAVCGFDVRLGMESLALDAAHIFWHQHGGPDHQTNGLALCAIHHKTFDRGAFTIENGLLLVSDLVNGSAGLEETLLAFHGKPMRQPQHPDWKPDAKHVAWHREEVFKGDARHVVL